MAKVPHVAGAALVKVGFGSALEELGYTRDGADTRQEAHFRDIPGDENGGDDGPPIEIQYLGETCRVRLELTKFDSVVANKITARLNDATPGAIPTAGSLMFAGNKFQRVCLVCPNEPVNFPCCICREPIELNKGTKYSTLVIEFVAYKHPTTGILFNSSIT
jgi:hypothetical protein